MAEHLVEARVTPLPDFESLPPYAGREGRVVELIFNRPGTCDDAVAILLLPPAVWLEGLVNPDDPDEEMDERFFNPFCWVAFDPADNVTEFISWEEPDHDLR